MQTLVWSEVTHAPAPAQRAERIVDAHGQLSGLGPYEPGSTDGVVHLLADLMHLTAAHGEDFAVAVRSAQRHYVEERLSGLTRTGG